MNPEGKPRLRLVNATGIGPDTKVYIDDVDVSSCFNRALIKAPLYGGVEVELNAVICEVEVDNALRLEMPAEGTREILIKHGWTPPVEPVKIPVENKVVPYEPVDHDLMVMGESVSGRELIERLFGRIQDNWEPNLDDSLTVTRTYRENGTPIPGRRTYTLQVTMDALQPDPDPDGEPHSLIDAVNGEYGRQWWATSARDRDGKLWTRSNGGRWWRGVPLKPGGGSFTWDELVEQFGPIVGPYVPDGCSEFCEALRDEC